MPDIYVTFDRAGVRYLAIVVGPERPPKLQFPDYESLRDAMNSLGHRWQLTSEIEDPEQLLQRSAEWLDRMSAAMAFRPAGEPSGNMPTSAGSVADPSSFGATDSGSIGFFGDCGPDGCDC